MDIARPLMASEYRLVTQYNAIRERLLSRATSNQLSKTLACWVLPSDRRLPLAFLGRTLDDLLHKPFEELISTPGVGQKKLDGLIKLLERADSGFSRGAEDRSTQLNEEIADFEKGWQGADQFDATNVSEGLWARWRDSVKRYHLEEETLGHLAPSLERLPRVLWHTPLNAYCDLTLAEIRQLKTHGEKRVAAVLEVFYELHTALAGLGFPRSLAVRVRQRVIDQVEYWLMAAMQRAEIPSGHELIRQIVVPLAAQVRNDLGEFVGGLVDDRLALSGREATVRQTACTLGLTRARIYQLLADASEVIAIRWPEGPYLVTSLADRIRSQPHDACDYDGFFSAVELLFGHKRSQSTESSVAQEEEAENAADCRRAG